LRGRAHVGALLSLLLLAGGSAYAYRQTISNAYVGSLPRGEVQSDVRELERRLTGVVRMNVAFSGAPDSMKDPRVLQAIERIDRDIERSELVTLSLSVADLVAEVNQAFSGGDPEEHHVPSSRNLVAQYLALVDPQDRAELLTDDLATTQIAVLLKDPGSLATRAFVGEVQRKLAAANLSQLGVRAELTGNSVVAYPALDRLVIDILWAFVLAFALIVLLQWVLLRSLRLALISVIPNLAPVVACFATTRALHIDLRIDSALVLCVSIGGLFNTTIHYSARVLQQLRAGEHDPDRILLTAMRTVGPPALFTALALSAGFALFLLSSFAGLRALGLLSGVTLLAGVVSDMLVTTVLLRIAFNWKAASNKASSRAPSAALVGG
jgi:predicted RND superfamily exporter protein